MCLGAPRSYEWVDDDTIAALVVPADRGPPPPQPPAPIGPSILDNTAGRTSQVHMRGFVAVPAFAEGLCAALRARAAFAVVLWSACGCKEMMWQCLRMQ